MDFWFCLLQHASLWFLVFPSIRSLEMLLIEWRNIFSHETKLLLKRFGFG